MYAVVQVASDPATSCDPRIQRVCVAVGMSRYPHEVQERLLSSALARGGWIFRSTRIRADRKVQRFRISSAGGED